MSTKISGAFIIYGKGNVHYATHDTRLMHGYRKLRLAEIFEMLRLMPDFETLRLMCDFKTLHLMPARRNFSNQKIASGEDFEMLCLTCDFKIFHLTTTTCQPDATFQNIT